MNQRRRRTQASDDLRTGQRVAQGLLVLPLRDVHIGRVSALGTEQPVVQKSGLCPHAFGDVREFALERGGRSVDLEYIHENYHVNTPFLGLGMHCAQAWPDSSGPDEAATETVVSQKGPGPTAGEGVGPGPARQAGALFADGDRGPRLVGGGGRLGLRYGRLALAGHQHCGDGTEGDDLRVHDRGRRFRVPASLSRTRPRSRSWNPAISWWSRRRRKTAQTRSRAGKSAGIAGHSMPLSTR